MSSEELMSYLIQRIDVIEKKVDSLVAFKWQIFGGLGITAFIVTLVVQIYFH